MDGRRGQGGRRGPRRVRWVLPVVLGVLAGTVVAVLPPTGSAPPAAARQTVPGATARAAGPAADQGADVLVSNTSGVPASCPPPRAGYVSAGRGPGRTVALTFDDGPDAQTGAVLDVLARERVPATFFVIGQRVAPRAALVRRAVREGHLVGNHTWDHRYPRAVPGGWTSGYLRRSLGRTSATITGASGAPVCWFRPPGGFRTPTVLPAARALRMSTVLWSVDSLDWKVQSRPPRTAAERRVKIKSVVTNATAIAGARHPVVLLHDGGGDRRITVAALPRIIAWYRAHGYTFVRVDGTR